MFQLCRESVMYRGRICQAIGSWKQVTSALASKRGRIPLGKKRERKSSAEFLLVVPEENLLIRSFLRRNTTAFNRY